MYKYAFLQLSNDSNNGGFHLLFCIYDIIMLENLINYIKNIIYKLIKILRHKNG